MTDIIALAMLFAVSALLLKAFSWRGAPVFCAIAAIFLLSYIMRDVSSLVSSVISLTSDAGIDRAVSAAIKILGMGYLFGISEDAVRELGEPGIAKTLELAGRIEIMLVILPFFEEILNVGVELLG